MVRLWFGQALLPKGWTSDVQITLDGSVIANVTEGGGPAGCDERHAVGLPGLCNVHSHAFQRAVAGRTGAAGPADDSFWTWRKQVYSLAARLSPPQVRAIAALAFAEMLEAGFTTVGEFHYLHHAPDGSPYDNPAEMALQLLDAAQAAGIDIVLLPVFYAHSDFGGAPPQADQRRYVCDLDQYAGLLRACAAAVSQCEGARLGVAPHSLRAVTPEQLAILPTLEPDGPVHIHVAEQPLEVSRCLAVLGARPVQWLLDNNDVTRRWCLVHATHVSDDEVVGLASAGAAAGLCPITEADLGDGLFPAELFLKRGGAFGIGSDSNVRIDAAGELRLLEYGQRLVTGRRNVLTASRGSVGRGLFEAALAGGRQALMSEDRGLVEGGPANLLALGEDIALAGCEGDTILDAWIFASRGSGVEAVWRRGRKVVSQGRHVARETLEADFRRALAERPA